MSARESTPPKATVRVESPRGVPTLSADLLTSKGHPSQLTLERYLLGELNEYEREALETWVESSAELRSRLNEMKRQNLEAEHRFKPPAHLLTQALTHATSSVSSPARSWWSRPRALIAFTLTALVVTSITLRALTSRSDQSETRWSHDLYSAYQPHSHKGHTRLRGATTHWEIYLAPDADDPSGAARLLIDRAIVHPGQRIGFRVYLKALKSPLYYMIIGHDETGGLYLGAPHRGENQALDASKRRAAVLPQPVSTSGAIDLIDTLAFDDVLGDETLYLLLCPEPLTYLTLKRELVGERRRRDVKTESSTQCHLQKYTFTKTAP